MDTWLWPSVRIALAGVMLVAVMPLAARPAEYVGAYNVAYVRHPWVRGPHVICGEEKVNLVVIVEPDQVWIGQSRIRVHAWVTVDEVEATLRRIKETPYFPDRTDITVSAGSVPYQQLIDVIAAAHRAGFIDVGIATPANAFARYALD